MQHRSVWTISRTVLKIKARAPIGACLKGPHFGYNMTCTQPRCGHKPRMKTRMYQTKIEVHHRIQASTAVEPNTMRVVLAITSAAASYAESFARASISRVSWFRWPTRPVARAPHARPSSRTSFRRCASSLGVGRVTGHRQHSSSALQVFRQDQYI